jgi:hypothetical protein
MSMLPTTASVRGEAMTGIGDAIEKERAKLTREIPLTNGLVALIDADDVERVSKFKWYASEKDKWTYALKGRTDESPYAAMHRFIMNAPEGLHVDHINGNGLDNRKSNLRICTNQQNRWNQDSHRGSSSQYKGVFFEKRRERWRAEIRFDHRRIKLGDFPNEIEAAKAYDKIAWLCFGEFARTNFPLKLKARKK